MKRLRYTGEFVSRAGVVWRTDILQEYYKDFDTVGALEYPAAEPLTLEWSRTDKEAVLQGSTATLRLVSPGDRTYEDLYTIEPGQIRLDVYRAGRLYWSGTLDPEFYEEPYEAASGYEVSLTFSDFGILSRIKYDLSGLQTVDGVVAYAVGRAGLLHGGIRTDYLTTQLADGTPVAGGGLSVRSENFFDEDGEASTLQEALEGVLQPLAARLVQRGGALWLYDLNGLYTKADARVIEWDGDSQTLGTDKVASLVTVTFSPYADEALCPGELDYRGKYDTSHVNLNPSITPDPDYGEYYTFLPDYRQWDTYLADFTLFLHDDARGLASVGPGCKYFHLLPLGGGASECSGVAYALRTGAASTATGLPRWKLHEGVPLASLTGGAAVLTTARQYLPRLDTVSASRYRLRLCLEMLVDARYNPFSGATSDNDEATDATVKELARFVFIPCRVTLYDAAGTALYHYYNRATAAGAAVGHISAATGSWYEGADPGGSCWLEYYNPDDLSAGEAGIRGWQANRHCIGRPDGRDGRISANLYDSFKRMADGEYLPYPPTGGYLEVQVQEGLLAYRYPVMFADGAFGTESAFDTSGSRAELRWCLYKAPVVEVVNNNLVFDGAGLEDVEYSGYLNKSAKESLDLDTVCGTAETLCPTARGCYLRTSTGEPVTELRRAGITDHPERLLIGTLYSQYAERKTTLSGEAAIDGGLHYYAEANQGDKRFMLMSDVQDVITDCTEAEYCEFRPDEYEGIEEVEP